MIYAICIYVAMYLCIYLSMCLCIHVFIYHSIYLPFCLLTQRDPVCPHSVHPHPSFHPSDFSPCQLSHRYCPEDSNGDAWAMGKQLQFKVLVNPLWHQNCDKTKMGDDPRQNKVYLACHWLHHASSIDQERDLEFAPATFRWQHFCTVAKFKQGKKHNARRDVSLAAISVILPSRFRFNLYPM